MATTTRRLFFLFFGGAAFATTILVKMSAPNHTLHKEMLVTPRRRKTKRRRTICVLLYKQATPTGFGMQADNSESYLSSAEMCVMTSVETLGYFQISLRDNDQQAHLDTTTTSRN